MIALSTEWYSVRYVYNPAISTRIQSGLGNSLKEKDKKRIMTRIYGALEECVVH